MTNPYRQALEEIQRIARETKATPYALANIAGLATSALETPEEPTNWRADYLRALQPNWDSYGAPAISEKAIRVAEAILNRPWGAAPTCNGGVQIEMQCVGIKHEFVIQADGTIEDDTSEELAASLIVQLTAIREAAEKMLIGGNHLASALIGWLGAGSVNPPYTATYEQAEAVIADVELRDAWIAWKGIMEFRDALAAIEGSTPTSKKSLEVQTEPILDGVFDHAPDCRAPDYGECACQPDPRDAEIARPTRNSSVLTDFTAYCQQYPEQRFWQALRNWSGACQIVWVDWRGPQRETLDTFRWEGKARKAVAESGGKDGE